MKISGFTIIKDGIKLDYPFIEAINSALPICDEYIVVVGKSDDGTREAVEAIGSPKIKIIDTIWDPELRIGGKILAQQTNMGIDAITGDWGLYLQADEILHENELDEIVETAQKYKDDKGVDGLLFPYRHFWGYGHVKVSRSTYRREIRMIKNNKLIRSYRDAQGFRKYPSLEEYENGHKGFKLRVKLLEDAYIHAYSHVRDPEKEIEKLKHVAQYWHNDDEIEKQFEGRKAFNYDKVDVIIPFPLEKHPAVMQKRASSADWSFQFKKPHFTFKGWVLHWVEKFTGWRIGEYRNYKLV